jgi:hypothetical protein
MAKIFLDTEFIEDGRTIELISIGMVRDDGRALYMENADCEIGRASDWVRENVLPHLTGPRVPLVDIADEIREFAGERPEFWTYYGAYDWVVLCRLFGRMIDLPAGWPFLAYDLRQWLDMRGHRDVCQPDGAPHHALADATWIANTAKQFGVLSNG